LRTVKERREKKGEQEEARRRVVVCFFSFFSVVWIGYCFFRIASNAVTVFSSLCLSPSTFSPFPSRNNPHSAQSWDIPTSSLFSFSLHSQQTNSIFATSFSLAMGVQRKKEGEWSGAPLKLGERGCTSLVFFYWDNGFVLGGLTLLMDSLPFRIHIIP
jgi:hypothetical protein